MKMSNHQISLGITGIGVVAYLLGELVPQLVPALGTVGAVFILGGWVYLVLGVLLLAVELIIDSF